MRSVLTAVLCALTASFSVATETVVGVAGRRVTLPCAAEAGVCWGRGRPSLFTCHNTLLATNGAQVTYRAASRYRLPVNGSAGDVSLSILRSTRADSGFYHCRVQVPGLFNDHIRTVHLIVTEAPEPAAWTAPPGPPAPPTPPGPPAPPQRSTDTTEAASVGAGPTEPHPAEPTSPERWIILQSGDTITEAMEESGSGEEWDTSGESEVPLVRRSQQPDLQMSSSLMSFIGNTLRGSFLIFIPALLLTIGYRLMRSQQRQRTGRRTPPDLEDNSL